MALIKIFSLSGVEIEYKKDSLTLKKENNSLSSEFKLPHSTFPFLVIDNDIAKDVLGPSDITSIKKNKIVPVIILENGVRFYGELQQLTVISKFRKCNLKYGSALIPIFNKKIAEFMPVFSVIGDETPAPYVEESEAFLSGTLEWVTYPLGFIDKGYPEVKFQFPMMLWKNKFGEKLDSDDPWYNYGGFVNQFIFENEEDQTLPTYFVYNSYNYTEDPLNFNILNLNIPCPQVYLLTILQYVLDSIGFKPKGDFTENTFIQKLLVLSTKDNLTKVHPGNIKVDAPEFEFLDFTGNFRMELIPTVEGRYAFFYYFEEPNWVAIPGEKEYKEVIHGNNWDGSGDSYGILYRHYAGTGAKIYSGVYYIDVVELPGEPYLLYRTPVPVLPTYQLEYQIQSFEELYLMHPTIELGRFVPDWTVGNFLNYIKNKFNLDITIDDFKKEATFNFNGNIHLTEKPAIISRSLKMEAFDIAANTSFVLKEENDQDPALFITQDEVVVYNENLLDNFTKTFESKFKLVPSDQTTSVLSDELVEKEGVGLMIYEPSKMPFTSKTTLDGYHLEIPGEKGIYETFFKRWIKFLLNGSNCEMTGYFTETEIFQINKLKSVYINNQRYRIIEIETTEASNNYQEVKMRLLSVNY